MSVAVTVAGIAATSVGAPVFTGICTAVAASLGMTLLDRAAAAVEDAQEAHQPTQGEAVAVSVATEAALTELVAERCSMRFSGEAVTVTVTRDIRGQVTVTAHSETLSRQAVAEQANAVLGRIRQQLAYRQILQKMKTHGFSVSDEALKDDGTVRLHIRRKKRS